MNKLMIAAALAVFLAACAKQEAEAPAADAAAATEAPAAEAAATEATDAAAAPAADAVADAAVDASGLPQACEDYLARAKACFDKAGANGAAAAFQQGVDQVKASWDQVADKSSLSTACQAANDQFAQTASMLKCE